jgi:hypothetical protein
LRKLLIGLAFEPFKLLNHRNKRVTRNKGLAYFAELALFKVLIIQFMDFL